MILTDFVISNTDEHLLNFGVLRDADTMKLIGPAPIFDFRKQYVLFRC